MQSTSGQLRWLGEHPYVRVRFDGEKRPTIRLGCSTKEEALKRIAIVCDIVTSLRHAGRAHLAPWRQTIAYLSLAPSTAIGPFLEQARARLAGQREPFRTRFAPILTGLEAVRGGGEPEIRLLGWSTCSRPLVDDVAD